jgi:hypothetical protein
MSYRVLVSTGVGAAVIAVVLAIPMPASAQTQGAAGAPRTPWGQPDLQGVWDFRTITPMQRPDNLAGKDFLTEEEAANLERAAVDRDTRLAARGAQRTTAGASVDTGTDGAPGAYNNFWLDRGTRIIGDQTDLTGRGSPCRTYPCVDIGGRASSGCQTGVSASAPGGFLAGCQLGCPMHRGVQRRSAHGTARL